MEYNCSSSAWCMETGHPFMKRQSISVCKSQKSSLISLKCRSYSFTPECLKMYESSQQTHHLVFWHTHTCCFCHNGPETCFPHIHASIHFRMKKQILTDTCILMMASLLMKRSWSIAMKTWAQLCISSTWHHKNGLMVRIIYVSHHACSELVNFFKQKLRIVFLFFTSWVLSSADSQVSKSLWWHMVGLAIPDEVVDLERAWIFTEGGSNRVDME